MVLSLDRELEPDQAMPPPRSILVSVGVATVGPVECASVSQLAAPLSPEDAQRRHVPPTSTLSIEQRRRAVALVGRVRREGEIVVPLQYDGRE